MNFNTLQYFQILEKNDMNNKQNDELLSLSISKNDLFGLCYALLDDNFDNKVYFENNNIKAFHHRFFKIVNSPDHVNVTLLPKYKL